MLLLLAVAHLGSIHQLIYTERLHVLMQLLPLLNQLCFPFTFQPKSFHLHFSSTWSVLFLKGKTKKETEMSSSALSSVLVSWSFREAKFIWKQTMSLKNWTIQVEIKGHNSSLKTIVSWHWTSFPDMDTSIPELSNREGHGTFFKQLLFLFTNNCVGHYTNFEPKQSSMQEEFWFHKQEASLLITYAFLFRK